MPLTKTAHNGWLVIYEGKDGYRYPSAVIHRTLEDASGAAEVERRGEPLDVIPIHWDDSQASGPWLMPPLK